MSNPVSNCCRAPLRVEGDLTMFHVCTKCGKACDPATEENPMSKPDDSAELCKFLKLLDAADVNVTDWEAQFIGSNLTRAYFTDKQRETVMRLMEKYGKRIGYY